MTVALLDVNLLLALLDPNHVSHGTAQDWFGGSPLSWATCPLTQNGYVRIASQRRYPNPIRVDLAIAILREFTHADAHRFWPDDISLLDPACCDATYLGSSSNVTDAYLLALAARNGGVLATLDRRLVARAVPNGGAHLLVIG